jgi:hypothetical protein
LRPFDLLDKLGRGKLRPGCPIRQCMSNGVKRPEKIQTAQAVSIGNTLIFHDVNVKGDVPHFT